MSICVVESDVGVGVGGVGFEQDVAGEEVKVKL